MNTFTMEQSIENSNVNVDKIALTTNEIVKKEKLHKCFETNLRPHGDVYLSNGADVADNIARWLSLDSVNMNEVRPVDLIKQMYKGTYDCNGNSTRGLKDVSNMNVHPDYYWQNINQHAGFSAEIISTTKENLKARIEKLDVLTYRADDRPDLFSKNDQFVDKVRMDSKGNILERVQVKFVGKDGKSCLSKLASSAYDKYFESGNVDKIEIPKDFYEQIKNENLIEGRIDKLQRQLERVTADGKMEVAEGLQKRIDKYNKISDMIECSSVTKDEAVYATRHPKRYVAKLFSEDVLKPSAADGVKAGLSTMVVTTAISTVDNYSKYAEGDISGIEAFKGVAKDTGLAGTIGLGTEFISSSVSNMMQSSSRSLIKSLGHAGIPTMAVSFGIESYESITDFATGQIDSKQLAYDLGQNAAGTVVSFEGAKYGAMAGAAIGGPAGAVVGGLVGGMVGYAVTTEAYATVVELGGEGVSELTEKAQELASGTYEAAKEIIPEKAESVKASISDFASKAGLPLSL